MVEKARAKIVLVGGEKGGTGKSTTAVNLATLRTFGGVVSSTSSPGVKKRDVLLVDTDTQGSTSEWALARESREGDDAVPRIACVQKFGRGLAAELDDLATRYDDIIVDAGGRDSYELRGAMTKCDIMVVPLQASAFDLWPLDKLKQLYDLADSVGAAPPKVLLVLSRAPTNPSITDPEHAVELIVEDERYSMFTFANTHIRERICFRRCISQGLSVFEVIPQDEKAIFEVRQLYKEIYE